MATPMGYGLDMGLMEKMVYRRKIRVVRELLLLVAGLEVQAGTKIGKDLQLQHRGMGIVIHPSTTIGDRVTLYHQVTIGRKDAHIPEADSVMEGIVIGDDAILFPGSKVLGGPGVTTVGARTILAANAVLTQSTGEDEIWAGIPARKVGDRKVQ
ncbi:serine O-acetyltransferase [Arthrobacter sp. 754]